jgi:hypothetical protein
MQVLEKSEGEKGTAKKGKTAVKSERQHSVKTR